MFYNKSILKQYTQKSLISLCILLAITLNSQSIVQVKINDTLRSVYLREWRHGYGTDKEILFRDINQDSLKDGFWVRFGKRGDTSFFTIKNQVLEGYFVQTNILFSYTGFFKNGKMHGSFIERSGFPDNDTIRYQKREKIYESNLLIQEMSYFNDYQVAWSRLILHNYTFLDLKDENKEEYFETLWYENGYRKSQGCYLQRLPFANYIDTIKDGNGKKGQWLYWWDNGAMKAKEYYVNGKKHGCNQYFDKNGWRDRDEDYKNGKLVKVVKYLLPERKEAKCLTELHYNSKGKLKFALNNSLN